MSNPYKKFINNLKFNFQVFLIQFRRMLKKQKTKQRGARKKTFSKYIRFMIPFDVRCLSCYKVLNKGKKINSIKECLGSINKTNRFRFYFRCMSCTEPISIITNSNYSGYEAEINAKLI